MEPFFVSLRDLIGSPYALLPQHGHNLYDAVRPRLEAKQPVCVSFEGLSSLVSVVINVSVGRLYQEMPAQAEALLSFSGLEGQPIWQEKIDFAKELGQNPAKREAREQARIAVLTGVLA